MYSLLGLYKKDLKITQSWVMTIAALTAFSFMVGGGLASYFKDLNIFGITAIVVLTLHIFYVPAFLVSSLITESSTQIWLHNPNSGSKLLISKLLASLTYFLPSILLSSIIGAFAISKARRDSEIFQAFEENIVQHLFYMMGGISLGTLYLGIWIFFYWAAFQALKTIPFLKRFRWIVILALWLLIGTIGSFIKNHPYYQQLSEIGLVQWGIQISEHSLIEISDLSLVTFSLRVLLSICVFLSAVWILERKVEV